MRSSTRPTGVLPVLALSAVLSVSCLAGKQPAAGVLPMRPSARAMGSLVDPTPVYRTAGLLAHSQPLPFVGTVAYLAGHSSDSTLVLLALSLANRSLTFADDTAGRLAVYAVTPVLRRGDTTVQRVEARETVRVTSFRETERVDESVVFQRYFALSPGPYVLALALRDGGSNRTATVNAAITVPRYTARALSSLMPVYTADLRDAGDSAPTLIMNPRSTLVFGRDTALQVYVEGYGLGADRRVVMELLGEGATPLWRDTVMLVERRALHAGLVSVPASRLGLGRVTLVATPVGAAESVRTPLFVSLGDEWAVSSFDELSSWLRYFSTPDRLQALRDTAVEH